MMEESDIVLTPEIVAKDIIKYFNPIGKILDPCKGDGVFYDNIDSSTKEWCEIREGKDVFEYSVFGSPNQKIGKFANQKSLGE